MEMTIEDFLGKYDAAKKTFSIEVPQALLIHPPEKADVNRMGGTATSSHQEVQTMTIRLSPHATWLLGQTILFQHQLGRPFGEEPQPPSGEMN